MTLSNTKYLIFLSTFLHTSFCPGDEVVEGEYSFRRVFCCYRVSDSGSAKDLLARVEQIAQVSVTNGKGILRTRSKSMNVLSQGRHESDQQEEIPVEVTKSGKMKFSGPIDWAKFSFFPCPLLSYEVFHSVEDSTIQIENLHEPGIDVQLVWTQSDRGRKRSATILMTPKNTDVSGVGTLTREFEEHRLVQSHSTWNICATKAQLRKYEDIATAPVPDTARLLFTVSVTCTRGEEQ